MALEYSTSEGDVVDYVVWKHYGTTDRQVVEQVLDANLGLSDLGPVLPAGVIIILPDIDTTQKARGIKLWD